MKGYVDRRSQCYGKRVYGYREAMARAKAMRRDLDDRVIGFWCRYCRGFHLGNHRTLPRPKPPPPDIDSRDETYYY